MAKNVAKATITCHASRLNRPALLGFLPLWNHLITESETDFGEEGVPTVKTTMLRLVPHAFKFASTGELKGCQHTEGGQKHCVQAYRISNHREPPRCIIEAAATRNDKLLMLSSMGKCR